MRGTRAAVLALARDMPAATNVLLEVVQDDPAWAEWSQQQLDAASLGDSLCINPITKRAVLPDFAIGAHRPSAAGRS